MAGSLMDMARASAGAPQDDAAPDASMTPGGGAHVDEGQDGGGEEGKGGTFKRPDISSFVPPDVKDVVDRVVAAGMHIMYSPDMRDEVQAAVQSTDPIEKTLSDNVVGLMLTLDQKTQGGIPQAAIFPAAMELMGEAADMLTAAGKSVTQSDYNDAALTMYAMIGQKLGGQPEDMLGAAAESLQGQNPDPGAPPVGGAPAAPQQPMPPAAA